MRKLASILIIVISYLNNSCYDKQNGEKSFDDIKEIKLDETYSKKIYFKEKSPLVVKTFENNTITAIDSIKKDSMFTYLKGKLKGKGKWKYAENKSIIYYGWVVVFNDLGNIIEKREYIDNDVDENIYRINQNIVYKEPNNIDTAESFYYDIIFNEKNTFLELKTLYKPNAQRKSYVIMTKQGKHIDSIEVSEGKNTISQSFFNHQNDYLIRTFYLRNGKRANWSDMQMIDLNL